MAGLRLEDIQIGMLTAGISPGGVRRDEASLARPNPARDRMIRDGLLMRGTSLDGNMPSCQIEAPAGRAEQWPGSIASARPGTRRCLER